MKKKEYIDTFINNQEAQEYQKSIINWIMNSEQWKYVWKSVSGFIDTSIFWTYETIAKIIINNEWQEQTTEILNKKQMKQWSEVSICEFVFSKNYINDIKQLCKLQFIALSDWDDFDKLLETDKNLKKLDQLIANKESEKYKVWNLFDSMYMEADRLKNHKGILGYRTGMPTLDKFTEWLQKGTVMRLTAYSNIGKSKLSYGICNELLKQWANILFFSLEVSKERVIQNLLMNWYDKDFWYIAKWRWIDDSDFDPSDFFSKPIEVIDDMYNINQIINYTESRNPDVIFIDFVQNIQTGKENEYQAMTEVAVKIQQLAIKNNIAIFDMSQISNDLIEYKTGGKIPSKWSWALVASSDVNLVMQRDAITNHNHLHIAKNKFGMNWKCIDLEINFSTNQIVDRWEEISKTNPF